VYVNIRNNSKVIIFFLVVIAAGVYYNSTVNQTEVIIYTSVDQIYSEPVLEKFEAETGIKVKAVYDVEAAKTTGLVNRLIAEKGNPLADVWWNGEIAQTILLKEEGILMPYTSPEADGIPSAYIDADGHWTGFGGRARVLLVNTELVAPEDYPDSIFDLEEYIENGYSVGIAYPVFGTTATHVAALYAELGPEAAEQFLTDLKEAGVSVLDGNGVVRNRVAQGMLDMGLTDTDDSIGAIERGAPVEMVFLDQGDGQMGTLKIPNTVAMVRNGPNPDEARILIDYLLSEGNVADLVDSGWFQLPLRDINVDQEYFDASSVKGMDVNYVEVYGFIEQAKKDMAEIFVR
jgi:iron(III) transport system substrate-binding protein